MRDAKAAKMGYKWKIVKGRKIRFWEDQWFGSCGLAIQFWEIYSIINEQGKSVAVTWDGVNLKFTGRIVDAGLMEMWHELAQVAESTQFLDEEDAMVWQFTSSGMYSVQSLYAVINSRGVKQIHIPFMWKINIPSRVHVFLWWPIIKFSFKII